MKELAGATWQVASRGLRVVLVAGLSALAVLGQPAPAPSPAGGGAVRGEVFTTGPNGEHDLIPGATVRLAPEEPGQRTLETTTDAHGRYHFERVPAGRWRLRAESAGMAAHEEWVEVPAGGAVRADIELELAVVQQSVEVTASVEDLNTSESSATDAVGSGGLSDAPQLHERAADVLPLLPGVVRGPDGMINMKGARESQSGSLVNGIDVTDPVTGSEAINLPVDVIAAVKVLPSPYDPAYGGTAAAISAIQTELSSFQKYRFQLNNVLPWFRSRDGRMAGIGSLKPRVTLSGPLIRGKVAFTQSLEYRYQRDQVERAGLPELHSDTNLESVSSYTQTDIQVSDRHLVSVGISFYPQKRDYVGLNTFTPQPSTPNWRQRGHLFWARDNYTFLAGGVLESELYTKTFDMDIKANGTAPYQRGIETTRGSYFNLQNRRSSRYGFREVYHFAPWQASGQHMFKVGFNYAHSRYDGRMIFHPVEILGVSDRLVERIEFGPPATVGTRQNQYALYAEDEWGVLPELTVDLGFRYDRDSLAGENNVGPRLGFVYTLGADQRTVLRGGIGLFYGRVNLNLPTFPDLPARTETFFGPAGNIVEVRRYRHRLAGELRNPRSLGWSVQLQRELFGHLYLRTGLQQRNTVRDFVLEPESTSAGDFLTLSNRGRDRYREFELTGRYRFGAQSQVTVSYVRSSAIGDLNDFNQFFGNLVTPLIRPNQRAPLSFDAPDRFLFWGDLHLPEKFTVSPVLDIHSGFPYSVVNERRDFVGPRNRAGRFPKFASLDLQAVRLFTLPLTHGKYTADIGIRIFNVLNSFNPLDVQNNLASPHFGVFTSFKNREFRGKFVMHF